MLNVSFSNETVLSDCSSCQIPASPSPCGVGEKGSQRGRERDSFLLLPCLYGHLNTGQSIGDSLEMTSTHSQCLQLEWLFGPEISYSETSLDHLVRRCMCVCVTMLASPGDWWLFADTVGMAPGLVKYVPVDGTQGAWCCICACPSCIGETVGACARVAVDPPVEVGNCCAPSNDWSSENKNTKLLGAAAA